MRNRYTWKTAILETFMIALAIVFIYPIFLIFINSIKSGRDIVDKLVSLPTEFHFENFTAAWTKMNFGTAFINTLMITFVSVVGILVLSSMAAYKLVRRDCIASKIIFGLLIFSMVIPFQVLMIPLVTVARQFGLVNKLWGMVILYWSGNIAMSVFMFSGFIRGVPKELEESAIIDGAGSFTTFFQIVFPLLKPISATIIIMTSMGIFNDFMMPKLILSRNNVITVQLAMSKFYDSYQTDWSGVMAGLTLTIIPMLIFFLICQKSIMDGMVAGAVKG